MSATVGGWVVIHIRATDVVYFGPFATYDAAQRFCVARAPMGLRGGIIPMRCPETPPDDMWIDPIF